MYTGEGELPPLPLRLHGLTRESSHDVPCRLPCYGQEKHGYCHGSRVKMERKFLYIFFHRVIVLNSFIAILRSGAL